MDLILVPFRPLTAFYRGSPYPPEASHRIEGCMQTGVVILNKDS